MLREETSATVHKLRYKCDSMDVQNQELLVPIRLHIKKCKYRIDAAAKTIAELCKVYYDMRNVTLQGHMVE